MGLCFTESGGEPLVRKPRPHGGGTITCGFGYLFYGFSSRQHRNRVLLSEQFARRIVRFHALTTTERDLGRFPHPNIFYDGLFVHLVVRFRFPRRFSEFNTRERSE